MLVGGVYAALFAGLGVLARWAEADFEAYPYWAGEDPMRLLLPTVHGTPEQGTLLLGPSAIGEAFLYEELERAWGSHVRSGSLSMGTLDECHLFLSYIERAYGPNALPRRVLLGMKPRVLANLPRLFGPKMDHEAIAYLIAIIDRYSAKFSVARRELGTELVPKSAAQAVAAWLRFNLTKQQPRYRTAVLAAIEYALNADPLKIGFQKRIPDFPENLRGPLTKANAPVTVAFLRAVGPVEAAGLWIRAYRSAYTNMYMTSLDEAAIRDVVANAEMGFTWDPRDEKAMVSMQLDRLASFIKSHGIELIVVHLPVHSVVRAGYDVERFAQYRTVIDEYFPAARIVDLWDMIPDGLFFDEVHLKYEGARRATALLVEAIAEREKL
jgi:hypothetical protein